MSLSFPVRGWSCEPLLEADASVESKPALHGKITVARQKAKGLQPLVAHIRYEDIERELSNYRQYFNDKIIYLNCDNPSYASGNTRVSCPRDILDEIGYIPMKDNQGGAALVNGKRKYSRVLIRRIEDSE